VWIDPDKVKEMAKEANSILSELTDEPVKVVTAEPPKPVTQWPFTVRAIAMLKNDQDLGVGDTIARHLERFGSDGFKRLYKKITGIDCGCPQRQAILNSMFPYQKPD